MSHGASGMGRGSAWRWPGLSPPKRHERPQRSIMESWARVIGSLGSTRRRLRSRCHPSSSSTLSPMSFARLSTALSAVASNGSRPICARRQGQGSEGRIGGVLSLGGGARPALRPWSEGGSSRSKRCQGAGRTTTKQCGAMSLRRPQPVHGLPKALSSTDRDGSGCSTVSQEARERSSGTSKPRWRGSSRSRSTRGDELIDHPRNAGVRRGCPRRARRWVATRSPIWTPTTSVVWAVVA